MKIYARKRLSQNFLYDPSILKRIIQIADVGKGDTVVEIGPGTGSLTRFLAERAGRVVAIELDENLYIRLKEEFAATPDLEIVHADALKFDYSAIEGCFKVVANIPYHITTPLIFRLLGQKDRLKSMTLTIQKEVAERITAQPGGKNYGVLSLMVQYRGRASYKFTIPAGAFRPVPRVDSACINIRLHAKPPVSVRCEGLFFDIIKNAFMHRRKTVLNSLKPVYPEAGIALNKAVIDASLRPEKLGMEDYARLSDEIYNISGYDNPAC